MSQKNVELVKRMLALLHAGDGEGALACFSPEVVAEAPGPLSRGCPTEGGKGLVMRESAGSN